MVRLRLGRFAWELYYTRTRAVLPREEVRRRAALVCGHLGYVTGLFEYIMTDMLWLRAFALSGCVLVVGYQMSQPRILWLSAGWNSVYSVVNVYHIYLLRRQPPALSEDAAALYEALGGESRMGRWRFQELLEVGTWKTFGAGELVPQEEGGAGPKQDEVMLLAVGGCDLSVGGLPVGTLGPGSVVGDLSEVVLGGQSTQVGVPRQAVMARASVAGARGLCVPASRLQAAPELREALRGAFAKALALEVVTMTQAVKAVQYAAMLELACASEPQPSAATLAVMADFKRRRGLSDEEHVRVAGALSRCEGSRLRAITTPAAAA